MPENAAGQLRKRYAVRRVRSGADSVEMGLPFEIVEREARSRGLDLDDFLTAYEAEVAYDSSEWLMVRFVLKPTKAVSPAAVL